MISILPLNLRHALVQQAEKFEVYKSTRDRVATIVEVKLALKSPGAMECDAVHRSTGHAEAWAEDGREAYDVDAVHSKGRVQLRRTGPHHRKVRYVRSSQGQGEGRR